MSNKPHTTEICPQCEAGFTSPPVERHGAASKCCPNGHWTPVWKLLKYRRERVTNPGPIKQITEGIRHDSAAVLQALNGMLNGYDALMAVLPKGSVIHGLADGSFGKFPQITREIVGHENW